MMPGCSPVKLGNSARSDVDVEVLQRDWGAGFRRASKGAGVKASVLQSRQNSCDNEKSAFLEWACHAFTMKPLVFLMIAFCFLIVESDVTFSKYISVSNTAGRLCSQACLDYFAPLQLSNE